MFINGRQQDFQEWINEVDRTAFATEYYNGKDIPVALMPASVILGGNKWFGAALSGVTYNQTAGLSAINWATGQKIESESEFDAVQVVIVNRAGNAVNNFTALVGVTETADYGTAANLSQPVISGTAYGQLAPAGSVLGWRPVTWNAASSVNIAAATTAPQFAASDWIPLSSIARADGGSRPLALVRAQHDGSVDGNFAFVGNAAFSAFRDPTNAMRNRIVQMFTGTTFVSTPANNGTISTSGFEMFLQFRYRRSALSVLAAGDSTYQNDAIVADKTSCWSHRGCYSASTLARPINLLACGASSKTSSEFIARAKELVLATKPNVLVICPGSPNDDIANMARTTETWRNQALDLVNFARVNNISRVCFTQILPINSLNLSNDNYRKAFNTFLVDLAANNINVNTLAFTALGDRASPERWVPVYNFASDGVHPTEAAIDTIMGPALAAYLIAL